MDPSKEEQYYWQLAEKMLNGTISPEEEAAFVAWYRQCGDQPVQIPGEYARDEAELYRRLLTNMYKRKKAPVLKLARVYQYVAAASLIIMVCLAGLQLGRHKTKAQPLAIVRSVEKEIIQPGSDKAILTLADGTRIDLGSAANGIVSTPGGNLFTKQDDHLTCKPGANADSAILLNTITTPKSGQYQVRLADGTIVWLNAASSLVFPASFHERERRVQLKGEAYFEVAKNAAMPFIVTVGDLHISVLGTHFNVKAYDDESSIKTTLLEGSVKLNKQNKEVMLRPGQEARTDSAAGFSVADDVDVNMAVAWKNGLFEFNDPVREIMRQICRWYDVSVVYEGRVTDRSFGGTIARKENIADVLKLLEMTGSIHFRIEGRTIRVMP